MNMRRNLPEPPEILTRMNWKSWKNDIEKHARKEGVWKYCDPSTPDQYYPELHEPAKPHVSTVRPEAGSIVDLGEDDFIELSSVVDLYWKQMHVYEKIQSGLDVIFKLIKYHVDDEYFNLIKHAQTPLEQMTTLSAKFNKSHLENLQPRWERIQQLASKTEVQELFELWNALFTDCDGYLSSHARNQDDFWECVETAGYHSGKWLPLTSQNWIKNNAESKNYDDRDRPRSLAKRESIASQNWIKTLDNVDYSNGCSQPCPPAKQKSTVSQHWIETPGHVDYRYGCGQPRPLTKQESIASLHYIETPDHAEPNYADDSAQPDSSSKRGFIDCPYYDSDYEPTESTKHASLSPQPSSRVGRSYQREETSHDIDITGHMRQLVCQAENGKPNCDDLDKW
ncbi:uncharacterized protein PGRI_011350 [Penicillium griseofulvum]|uniref:Uncharacterized protein n=1 Tax=Penicillium patulum TaxID=5078 RepID=A0A135LE78_PENPA|nr:uncharacterized protein PGRI_011350 [Penicillium griseofulvum]KXG47265.1 hypothetical protein PGRI_011350 [Penicillium griseofulvum]